MQVPWFLATTPAPRVAVRPTVRRAGWWTRLGRRYIAWAERSHDSLRGHAAGR